MGWGGILGLISLNIYSCLCNSTGYKRKNVRTLAGTRDACPLTPPSKEKSPGHGPCYQGGHALHHPTRPSPLSGQLNSPWVRWYLPRAVNPKVWTVIYQWKGRLTPVGNGKQTPGLIHQRQLVQRGREAESSCSVMSKKKRGDAELGRRRDESSGGRRRAGREKRTQPVRWREPWATAACGCLISWLTTSLTINCFWFFFWSGMSRTLFLVTKEA